MSKPNNGGTAFPTEKYYAHPGGGGTRYRDGGMSLRDYFAAKAMQGWLATYGPDDMHPVTGGSADSISQKAFAMADAMLKAREES